MHRRTTVAGVVASVAVVLLVSACSPEAESPSSATDLPVAASTSSTTTTAVTTTTLSDAEIVRQGVAETLDLVVADPAATAFEGGILGDVDTSTALPEDASLEYDLGTLVVSDDVAEVLAEVEASRRVGRK